MVQPTITAADLGSFSYMLQPASMPAVSASSLGLSLSGALTAPGYNQFDLSFLSPSVSSPSASSFSAPPTVSAAPAATASLPSSFSAYVPKFSFSPTEAAQNFLSAPSAFASSAAAGLRPFSVPSWSGRTGALASVAAPLPAATTAAPGSLFGLKLNRPIADYETMGFSGLPTLQQALVSLSDNPAAAARFQNDRGAMYQLDQLKDILRTSDASVSPGAASTFATFAQGVIKGIDDAASQVKAGDELRDRSVRQLDRASEDVTSLLGLPKNALGVETAALISESRWEELTPDARAHFLRLRNEFTSARETVDAAYKEYRDGGQMTPEQLRSRFDDSVASARDASARLLEFSGKARKGLLGSFSPIDGSKIEGSTDWGAIAAVATSLAGVGLGFYNSFIQQQAAKETRELQQDELDYRRKMDELNYNLALEQLAIQREGIAARSAESAPGPVAAAETYSAPSTSMGVA